MEMKNKNTKMKKEKKNLTKINVKDKNKSKSKTNTKNELRIIDLHASVEGKEILKGVTLNIKEGEVVALMGPNGSGKSTLANVIMGHPGYEVTSGKIYFNNIKITQMETNERAKLGLFLSFQYPASVSGVPINSFLRTARNSVKGKTLSVLEFEDFLKKKMKLLNVDSAFVNRYLNEGFSGGEKKKNEILQMAVLEPKIAILDETDSGLDVDAMKIVAKGVNTVCSSCNTGVLIITHYQRILDYIKPDRVYIMHSGKIVKEGGSDLVLEIEKKGYERMNGEK